MKPKISACATVQRHVLVCKCAGFRTPECQDHPRAAAASVRKAPRHEIAGCGAPRVPPALWGFGRGVSVEDVEVRRRIRSLFLEAWACVSG